MTEEPVSARKRFSRTLSGDEPAAELDLDAEGQSVAERLKPQGNTLLGHPPTPAAGATGSGHSGPVLAPPKWRGAGAYRAGEEPQPQVSLIPAPPPMPAGAAGKPVGVPIGVMRSSVKTKVGQPPPPAPRAEPEAAAPAAPGSEPPAAGDDTLKDTIQQMLEQQASVPIQVEEGIPELPIDELVEDESRDSEPAGDEDTQRPPPDVPGARAAEAAPVSGAHGTPREAAPEVPVSLASAETPAFHDEPEPAAAEPASEPTGPAAPSADAKRRVERRPAGSLGAAPPQGFVLPRWNSEGAKGVLFVAAMVLIGGGGWWVTRGTYRPKMVVRPPAAAAKADAPAEATEPKKSAETAPAAEGETTAKEPATTAAPAAPSVKDDTTAQRATRKARPESEGEVPAEPSAEPSARTEPTGVLTVTPRAEEAAGDLPDSPTRDNVIATLNELRPAFLECAQGQRGVAQLDITLTDTGAVSHVVVGGDFAGSTRGSCIARAARGAQFAPFKKPRFRLVYPISL